jgi:Fe-S cluster assembly iron-binding protein IscA
VLTITQEAEQAIRGILDASNAPDGSVLRISPQPAQQDGPGAGPGLVVSVTDAPPPDDQIVEGDQVEVSVEPTAAAILDDKELDATVVGGQVNFRIGDQAE